MSSFSRRIVMKRLVMPLALALTLPALGPLGAQPGKDDATKIQGTWDQVAYERDGNKTATPGELKLKIGPDKIVPVGKDDPFLYKIGVAKDQGIIDITPTKGLQEGQAIKGLYELKGDELTICLGTVPGVERPKEFTSKDGYAILYLKREKP
jgi:uncharacterized protein (TIGR03067 family)